MEYSKINRIQEIKHCVKKLISNEYAEGREEVRMLSVMPSLDYSSHGIKKIP